MALLAGLLVIAMPTARAQAGGNNGNEPQNGAAASGGTQGQIDFLAHMRRNSKAETDLSKMARKNSHSDAIKKLAKEVMSTNRKDQMAMTGAASDNPTLAQSYRVPKPPQETIDAEKKLKTLTGTDFDRLYISQLDAYVKDDQATLASASKVLKDSPLETVVPQMSKTADQRAQLIQQTAQAENLKIE